ncbi:hypothetical protein GCM10007916_00930 [Psychromonas marina]|uniref:Polysaccharide biosynthesis protein n=1 Tax=Psychromonas marina TaxID=88364 RepID=A0ABQ6DWB0_9GAMM|nr:PssD/Cps14F family polysaccharide biosynthesis glycosyltransferase [Psychromonas marina]GLS89026.1 hypothetical protein GCM10007916_00930 [Psychromonas marina]
MYSNKSVLLCFGEGGHTAQMNRLVSKLIEPLSDFDLVSISDVKKKPEWSARHIVTGELRGKHKHSDILFNNGPFKIVKSLRSAIKNNNFQAMISTGPGIAIIAALLFKVYGIKVVHVETWSRFTTKSLTGRVMYLLADRFYVQHKSLLSIYPKAIYAGVL